MYSKNAKGSAAWFLVILAGLVIGGFIGHYLGNMQYTSWLNYGQSFGMDQPLSLELGIIRLQFGLMLRINIAGVIGAILAVFLFKRV